MRACTKGFGFIAALVFLMAACSSWAMSEAQEREFRRIARLNPAELTAEARALLEEKYPGEDWLAQNFPGFVYSDESVEVGYMIAVKEPQDLRATFCYCSCDAFGHDTLLDCFWKDAQVGGDFDDHAAGCSICTSQAMLAFLWNNLGASDEEIARGMEKIYEELIRRRTGQ